MAAGGLVALVPQVAQTLYVACGRLVNTHAARLLGSWHRLFLELYEVDIVVGRQSAVP